jgi:uncharacterized membrane protein HdeD (DUF308 family)
MWVYSRRSAAAQWRHGKGHTLIGGWRNRISRIVLGGSLIAVSLLALAAPLATGTWSLQFLGLLPLAVGISDLYAAVTNPELRSHPTSYATGVLAIVVALLLYVSPLMVVSGIVTLLLVFLALDGIFKLGQALLGPASKAPRIISALNGASSLCLALVRYLHALVGRELPLQPAGDLLWRPLQRELLRCTLVATVKLL